MKNVFITVVFISCILNSYAQSPGGVSNGLRIWLKGDAGTSTTTDGDFMSYWNDQSGNGNHATQATESARPKYIKSALNGNPAMESNGGTRYFGLNLSSIDNHAFTVITVVKRAGAGNNQYILGIQQTSPNPGLHIGYVTNNSLRHGNYGNTLNLNVTNYNAATESPRIVMAECSSTFAKTIAETKDGTTVSSSNTNTLHYNQGQPGALGRGWSTHGFQGYIAEVIVYNRVLTAIEKRKINTYLSIKYGLSIPIADHLYYNEPSYSGDVFGIGRDVTGQGLNQSESKSENTDDILIVKTPADLGDGEYLVFGNNNANTAMPVYSGSNCNVTRMMNRVWKARHTGDVGTVTMRFNMSGITGFTGSKLMLLVDTDNDGFDDEAGIEGTYSAPWFEVTGVKLLDGEKFTIAQGNLNYYAVASGNASAAIWSDTPGGTPFAITTFCERSNMIIQPGVTVNCDWASFACNKFHLKTGATFNAASASITVNNNFIIDGNFMAGTSVVNLSGKKATEISGGATANMYMMTVSNAESVTINASSGGVIARNLVQINSGTLYTNAKLNLLSDGTTAGMIGPLTTGAISGNVTINRYHNATAQGWVNLCSPIQGKTVADWNDDLITTGFVGSDYPPPYPFNNVQLYNESVPGGMNNGFTGVTNVTNSLQNGRGYFVFMNAGVMNLDVDGQIYSGNQSLPVTYTNTGNLTGDGWNMVANPYPCTIDWDAAGWSKTNITNAVYVWNAALGQYATYVNGVSTNGGSRYIPHTQSFLVKANAASPSLSLTENCKATVQGSFKNTENSQEVLTFTLSNEIHSDETTLCRNESGTLYFEENTDAFKLKSPLADVPYLATVSNEGSDLSVNAFALQNHELTIPLRLEAGVSGVYHLSHKGLTGFANGACVVLHDMLTGTSYPLNEYNNISLNLEAGNSDLRFELRIGATAMASVTTAGCPGMNEGVAQVLVADNANCDLYWMNSDGDIIAVAEKANGLVEVTGLASGIYTLQIINNGVCGTTETTFVIPQSASINANAQIIPTTCIDVNDGAIALDVTGGKAPYSVVWSNGAKATELENVQAGEYTAFVTDADGCTGSFEFTIPTKNVLYSSFDLEEEIYILHGGVAEVSFYNTSQGAENYLWDFGDMSVDSSVDNPKHIFNKKGIYTVTLQASNAECVSHSAKQIKVMEPQNNGSEFASSILSTLTDEGIRMMFYFDEMRDLKITAYNMLGQQLTEPIIGTFSRETITFSERRYASQAMVEVLDRNTGERAVIRLGK